MKLSEVLTPQEQLDEISLKHTVAVGATALAMTTGGSSLHKDKAVDIKPLTTQTINKQVHKDEVHALTKAVLDKYDISKDQAVKIVKLAKQHEYADFPKAKDILAIVGIESSFNPNAQSKLRKDPAVGLMQVRPGVWGMKHSQLKGPGSIENQIKVGAEILNKYYKRLNDREKAVHAYNVGMTNFLKGKHNPAYVTKYKNELAFYNKS
jgi:hypothetical protein